MLLAKGDLESGLESLNQAESQALVLGMRPIVWQARAATAGALAATGLTEQAEEKRAGAQEMTVEIGDLFEDKELEQAFLKSSLERIH